MPKTYVLCGSSPELHTKENLMEWEFDTESELAAFLQGINCADGWLDVLTFDTELEGLEYVAESKAECS